MTKTIKKIFSVTLTLVLLLNLMSMLVFAEETSNQAVKSNLTEESLIMSMDDLKGTNLKVKENSGYTYVPEVFSESMADISVPINWDGATAKTQTAEIQNVEHSNGKNTQYSYVGKTNIPLNNDSEYTIAFKIGYNDYQKALSVMLTWPNDSTQAQYVGMTYKNFITVNKDMLRVHDGLPTSPYGDTLSDVATYTPVKSGSIVLHDMMLSIKDGTLEIYVDGAHVGTFDLTKEGESYFTDKVLALGARSQFMIANSRMDKQIFCMSDIKIYNCAYVEAMKLPLGGEQEEKSVSAGASLLLDVDAGDTAVTWSSSDEAVAKVDATGKVTTLKKGEAIITATVGTQKATCKVTVTLDTSAITEAIEEAKEFKGIVSVSDTACKDYLGAEYVTTADLKALTDAIDAANAAIETVTTDEEIAGVIATLNAAVEAFQEAIKIAEHTWNDGEITKQPTADSEGEKTFTCSTCGKTKTEKVDKLDATATDSQSNTGDTTEEKSGCGSSVAFGGMGIVVLSLCGAAALKKKKK